MRYYLIHEGNQRSTYLRGGPVFERWQAEPQHEAVITSEFDGNLITPCRVVLFLSPQQGCVDLARAVADHRHSVLLVDVHHPVWRPDLQIYSGEDDARAAAQFWNEPAHVRLMEQTIAAADGIVTPRFVWGGRSGEVYNQALDLQRLNPHINEVADITSNDEVDRYRDELEWAFKDAIARKNPHITQSPV